MNRKIKNLIIILAIIVVGALSFFTMKSAKNSISSSNNDNSMMGAPGQMGTPPDMGTNQNKQGQQQNEQGGQMSTPPSKPDGDNSSNNQEQSNGQSGQMSTPPSKPDGDNSSNNQEQSNGQSGQMSTPPSKPDGDNNSNSQSTEKPDNMPEAPSGEKPENMQNTKISTGYYVAFAGEAIIISILITYLIMSSFNKKTIKETLKNGGKIAVYAIIVIVLTVGLTFSQIYITNNVLQSSTNNEMQNNNMQGPGGGMNSNSNVTYTATKEITEDTTLNSGEYTSTTANENGLLVNGDVDATLSNITVDKSGDSDGGDTSNFYGNNSAILAKSGANLTLKNITVTTNASGANGVFSYGGSATTNNSSSDGTTVNISDSKITTTGDNAGGIMTTGGGKTVATNLTINTSGTSSAAIRTDRGGGTVTVNKGTYTTTGNGSPTIYSTADITVSDATLVAKASEGVVIEGANSVTLNNCDLTDSNTKLNGQSTTYKNIFLYQSMSGDASNGTAIFTAKDSNITINNGDSFYVTNTTATINLTNNTIINNDSTGNFLRAQKDSWGNSGANGGKVTLVMNNQKATGNIVIDSISTLDMTMNTGSYYEGTINGDNTAKSITLKLDASSKIKLTGDSYVTSLEDADSSYSNIDFNGYKLYVNGTAIN